MHPRSQQQALTSVLGEVGLVQSVVVNRTTGHLIDGHLRVELAIAQGQPTIPVVYVELSEDEERIVLASLDPIGAMATADRDRLAELLAGINDPDLGELVDAVARANSVRLLRAGFCDPEEVPEVPQRPTSRLGDVWVMGDLGHRLGCGDATVASVVACVLGGAEPRLLVTDPPYGVELDMEWRDRALLNKLGAAEPSYLRPTRGAASLSGDTVADWSATYALVPSLEVGYVWHATAHMLEVAAGLQDIGFELRQQIVWVKPVHVISRSAYHWQHEPCWYAVRKGASAGWVGDRSQSTVWQFASPKQLMAGSVEERCAHPTQKPLACMQTPVHNHRGAVYDPFTGSGTTLMACEIEGRSFYGCEIEPRYVDVAVLRWRHYSGQEAVLEGDGRSFAEVAAARQLSPNPE
jgi:DNA modification methylase